MHVFIIKNIRKNKKISLNMLSKMTHISKTYLFELENNLKNNPSFDFLTIIASKLQVNVKDLFYTTSDLDFLKNELDKKIKSDGFSSTDVIELSRLIDRLITYELQEGLK